MIVLLNLYNINSYLLNFKYKDRNQLCGRLELNIVVTQLQKDRNKITIIFFKYNF